MTTKLNDAIKKGNIKIINMLLKSGSLVDNDSLELAIKTGNIEIIDKIVEYGAPYDNDSLNFAINTRNKKIVDKIVEYGAPYDNDSLELAIKTENIEIINRIVKYGAPITDSSLEQAIKTEDIKIVNKIIEMEAPNNFFNLELAIKTENIEIIDKIIKYGKEKGIQFTRDIINLAIGTKNIKVIDVYYLFNDFFCTCHNECAQNVSENLFRDCGSDEYSENYCKNDDIYKDFYDKGCNNGNCIQDVIPELIKDCGDDSCSSWEKHCYEDDVYEERTCYDKGCSEGSCSSELTTEKLKVENCLFGCEDGACTDECSKDSDCSDDYYSDKYCKNDDVYYKFHNFFCKTGSCNEDTAETLFQDCGNDYCEDWSENYCRGDDIYQKKTCYEKGCKDENCYSNSYEEEKLIEKCPGTCEYGECKEECYDSKWKCLDSGYDSGTKLSSYVISFSGKAGHEASLNSLCGKSGAYYIYNSTGVIKIKTPELPEEGNYLFSFKYETGTKDQNYEKFRVECGTKKYDFPDVYKDNEKYREISIACDFKEGVNYIKFISTGKDSAHFEEFKISNCNMHDSCEGADFSISVNMSVVGEKCHSSNKINDSKIINIPSAGEYSVLGLVSRGNPGQCQTNEDFRLIIKKELGPETHDDADACAISSRYEYLGDFDFLKGDNELLMRTVAICPPDNSPNSVRVNEFCLFKNLDD